MPRHRRERVPRHRAQRLAGHPARRARVTPAVPPPRTGLHDAVLHEPVSHESALQDAVSHETASHETALDRAGLVSAGLAGTERAGAGLADTGLADTGLADTALADTALDHTGLDHTETAPLAALTWTPPRSFENELARLARLPGIDGSAADGSAADGSVGGNGAAYDRAADNSVGGNGASADSSVAGNGPPGRLASAERPPGYRPPSHSRRRSHQTASAASSRPVGTQQSVVRGLLVTPWFAAATGFVIAVSLWIYTPHPLAPETAPYLSPCTSDDCPPHVDQQSAGSLTIKSGQRIAPQKSTKPAKTDTRGQTQTAPSDLVFGYVLRPDADGTFWLMVTVTGKHLPKDWHVAFVLAGAHIQSVYGADWHPADSHGGTASPFTGGPSQQHGGSGGGGEYGGAHDQRGVFFAVLASGKLVGPTQCSFNGASCTFHELSRPSQGGHG